MSHINPLWTKPSQTSNKIAWNYLINDGHIGAKSIHDASERRDLEKVQRFLDNRLQQFIMEILSGLTTRILSARRWDHWKYYAEGRQQPVHTKIEQYLIRCEVNDREEEKKKENNHISHIRWMNGLPFSFHWHFGEIIPPFTGQNGYWMNRREAIYKQKKL